MNSQTLDQLTARLLRKRLFVMLRRPRRSERAQQHFGAHLQWVLAGEQRGEVFASGPFVAPGATPARPGSPAGGLTILRAKSMEHAHEMARGDPYVVEEVVDFEIKEWLLMEGGFTLTVSFGRHDYRFD